MFKLISLYFINKFGLFSKLMKEVSELKRLMERRDQIATVLESPYLHNFPEKDVRRVREALPKINVQINNLHALLRNRREEYAILIEYLNLSGV